MTYEEKIKKYVKKRRKWKPKSVEEKTDVFMFKKLGEKFKKRFIKIAYTLQDRISSFCYSQDENGMNVSGVFPNNHKTCIETDGIWCSCPEFFSPIRPCKHIIALGLYAQEKDIISWTDLMEMLSLGG